MADSTTAARGESARVEIDVAIAFAVSWKPFVKSNATAIPIVTHSRTVVSVIWRKGCAGSWVRCGSGVLDREGLDHFRAVLAFVHGLLEQRVDVLPLDQVGRGEVVVEELFQRCPCDRSEERRVGKECRSR